MKLSVYWKDGLTPEEFLVNIPVVKRDYPEIEGMVLPKELWQLGTRNHVVRLIRSSLAQADTAADKICYWLDKCGGIKGYPLFDGHPMFRVACEFELAIHKAIKDLEATQKWIKDPRLAKIRIQLERVLESPLGG